MASGISLSACKDVPDQRHGKRKDTGVAKPVQADQILSVPFPYWAELPSSTDLPLAA